MSKRTTGLIAMAVGAFLGAGRPAIAQAPANADHHVRRYHIFLTGRARMTVGDALHGAIRRLTNPECRNVFEDFSDQSGRALRVNLPTTESPADFLAGLYFVEGDDTIQCRSDQIIAAFTSPGSRVIHVCGKRFLQFAAKTKGGEMVLIHEALHSLGLGENPPTSSQITAAVTRRCG